LGRNGSDREQYGDAASGKTGRVTH
jgi:hypothetical protein